VQSSVGLDRLRTEPDATARALGTIETSSRGALAEMRRMLAILRRDDDGLAQLVPASGLSDLPGLLREVSSIGVETRLVVEGERPSAVPSGIDLCGYRIVQEALTNVVKHAPGATAVVSVAWQPGGIGLEVTDDGHGRGLLGTREGRPPVTGCWACGSGWPCSAVRSRPGRAPAAASASGSTFPSRRRPRGPG